MKRTDSLTQSFTQPFKNTSGHPQVMASVQSQHQLQGGLPGGIQTAQLQGIAKLIEPNSNDNAATGNAEYTQSKFRKRLNQQQSHDYQAGMPMAMGGNNKGKMGL